METENNISFDNQRRDLKNGISQLKQTINEMEEKKRETIYKLKMIMLTIDNHENNLLNEKLNKEMIEEYKNEFNRLNQLKREEQLSYEDNKNKLDEKKKQLYELEKKEIFYRKKKNHKKDLEIEEERRKILERTIIFLKDNGMVEEGINHLYSIILKKNE